MEKACMKLEFNKELIFIESFFFDTGKLVVLINGFVKKTQKTPNSEIEKALKIKKEYETEKQANAQ